MSTTALKDSVCASESRHGRIRHFEFDDPIGRSLKAYGEWAQVEINFLSQFLQAGQTVLDVGANVGTHTLALAAAVGPKGKVLAIEPQPVIFELLRQNVTANGFTTVELHQVAVSDAAGASKLSIPDYARRHNSGVASLELQSGSTVEVPTIRLDDLKLEQCALLKLDIEGSEEKAIEGARALIQQHRPLIYAESNTVERAWRILEKLKPEFVGFLHSPPAYNANNFKQNPENLFGLAEETNLFLVPRERLAAFEGVLAGQKHLSRIDTLDELAGAFTRATRYGEGPVGPERLYALSRRAQALESELAALRMQALRPAAANGAQKSAKRALSRPVTVVVPIYNGLSHLERLVESVFEAHPKPESLLRFVFINDGSPDPSVAAFLRDQRFARADVQCLENPQNLGFIGTVNRGLDVAAGSDVIILNTDTLVYGNVFSILQEVAYRLPNVASVTPLTNNGTIASLFNWPEGGELFGLLEPGLVARAVEEARVVAPLIDLPTGVGFCMYMTGAAIKAVGGFDPSFGRGYGEENSWCQHASQRGFVNLLTTECFVYHHGTQSFGDQTKRAQLDRNLKKLDVLHPEYHRSVKRFVESDPYRGARANVLWSLRRQLKVERALHSVLYVLHCDPTYFGGGTERHVMALTDHLLTEGRSEVLHLFPDGVTGQYVLRAYFPRGLGDRQNCELLSARYDADQVLGVMEALAAEVDTLHVHHTLGWQNWFMHVPALFTESKRLLTLHDYYSLCPSIRLMSRGSYCGLPSLSSCNSCLQQVHGHKTTRIEDYRSTMADFIERFDEVYTPSEAARLVLEKGFGLVPRGNGTLADVTTPRIKVAPNFLLDFDSAKRPALQPRNSGSSPRVVFLGAYAEPKGSKLFGAATEEMRRREWTVEVWGTLGQELAHGMVHRSYRNTEELRKLALEYPCDVVAVPALWPETFSFTTFEAALDVGAPMVVGPYGNPPELVREHGIGVVLDSLTAEGLVDAIERIITDRLHFSTKLLEFEKASARFVLENYLNQAYAHRAEVRSPGVFRALPVPATRPAPLPPPQPDPPLRHRIADQINGLISGRTPWLHNAGKKLGKWATRG